MRLLAELHRDLLYPMIGRDAWVWLGLTVGKPQGRSLCVWGVASGSAASHPDPGSSGMVEFSEESRRIGFGGAETDIVNSELRGLRAKAKSRGLGSPR